MKRTEYFSVTAGLFAAFVLLASATAKAQEAGIKSLDGKATGGKVMTKEELRACIKQQDELAKIRAGVETRREALNKERDAIQVDTEALKAEQAAFKDKNAKIKEFNERMAAFAVRVEEYKKNVEELAEEQAGPGANRKRRELEKELVAIKKQEVLNKAEGDAIKGTLEADANALNAKVDAQSKRAADWNIRSKAADDAASAYEDQRIDWKLNCGDRRYREDDEKAIRAGK